MLVSLMSLLRIGQNRSVFKHHWKYTDMLRRVLIYDLLTVEQFLRVLQKELDAVEQEKQEFIYDFSEVHIWVLETLKRFLTELIDRIFFDNKMQEDYNDILEGWKAKMVRSSSGEQRWGLFIATKNCWKLKLNVISQSIRCSRSCFWMFLYVHHNKSQLLVAKMYLVFVVVFILWNYLWSLYECLWW